MKSVESGSFLTLHYRLAHAAGADLVNTFDAQPATLSLGAGELAPALESRLLGLSEGARVRFELDGDEAFGARNPQLVQRVSRALLSKQRAPARAVGDVVQLPAPGGSGVLAGTVRALGEDWVELDFNHPLAGTPLSFEVHVIGVL
ncbi:MAG TPA: FKBP-type peptidyl-prolyl cis-trans isomerase [Burkholderiaceae bacterium]|nr:FKBP-type peptidyl-prolyl cis-trans isomerase [Burkholderiaceae bacterium]